MASRKIEDLHPDLQAIARAFLSKALNDGIEVLITCTYRSSAEQDELYAQGRTKPGLKVTNVKGGGSKHNFTINGKPASKAFDVVPMVNGKLIWDAKHPSWQKLGKIGKDLGLTWGGSWVSFKDYPHFEIK
jgi:peptidoglycan L-alanyl-D-glutamate endopeptidase CwlK